MKLSKAVRRRLNKWGRGCKADRGFIKWLNDELDASEATIQRLGSWMNRDLFVLEGRTGVTDPWDVNYLAMLHACICEFVALSRNGQCSKDVSRNASALNNYAKSITRGTRGEYRWLGHHPDAETFIREINEMLDGLPIEVSVRLKEYQ